MNPTRASWRKEQGSEQGRGEAGYTVLMVIFFVATLALAATVATPNLLNQGRREREEEMVWRGKQYVRAIRLYYQSNGRFPPTLEELTEPNAAGVHFLRKVYADPMNSRDGSWREIYVAPSGQLTGSVRYKSLQEIAVSNALSAAAPVAPPSAPGNVPAQQSGQQPDPASSLGPAEPVSVRVQWTSRCLSTICPDYVGFDAAVGRRASAAVRLNVMHVVPGGRAIRQHPSVGTFRRIDNTAVSSVILNRR